MTVSRSESWDKSGLVVDAKTGKDFLLIVPAGRGRMMNQTQYIEVLDAGADVADPSLLGGKGASLCRLVNLGHRVPAGFVITRDAFQSALEDMGLASALDTLASLLAGAKDATAAGEQIRQSILSGRIPSRILEPIMQAVDALRLWEQPCEGRDHSVFCHD